MYGFGILDEQQRIWHGVFSYCSFAALRVWWPHTARFAPSLEKRKTSSVGKRASACVNKNVHAPFRGAFLAVSLQRSCYGKDECGGSSNIRNGNDSNDRIPVALRATLTGQCRRSSPQQRSTLSLFSTSQAHIHVIGYAPMMVCLCVLRPVFILRQIVFDKKMFGVYVSGGNAGQETV